MRMCTVFMYGISVWDVRKVDDAWFKCSLAVSIVICVPMYGNNVYVMCIICDICIWYVICLCGI